MAPLTLREERRLRMFEKRVLREYLDITPRPENTA
jgi:hypothetical protein